MEEKSQGGKGERKREGCGKGNGERGESKGNGGDTEEVKMKCGCEQG